MSRNFYNKFERYLHKKDMSSSFMDKTELCNKMREFVNLKYTRESEVNYDYHLVKVGKILMFKRFKNGGVKC